MHGLGINFIIIKKQELLKGKKVLIKLTINSKKDVDRNHSI
jgi:hypothetical protein